MIETRILLGGGGSAADERPIFERFAAWVDGGSVLYLPIASHYIEKSHLEWISTVLHPLGVTKIDMWATLLGHSPAEVGQYQAIFIGGGNTYHLLNQLRVSGFDEALRHFAGQGGVIYGGSAGAIVQGRDISTGSRLDENVVGLTDTSGLDLLDGDSVWCHFQPADEPLVRAHVGRVRSPTIVLAENSGVWVRGQRDYVSVGSGDSYRFTLNEKHKLS